MAYSKEFMQKVLSAVAGGLNVQDACAVVGISKQTLYNHINADPDFATEFEKAQVSFKLSHLRNVANASQNDWRASAWILERKFKDEFSLRQEMVGKDGNDLNFQVRIVDGSQDQQDIPTP